MAMPAKVLEAPIDPSSLPREPGAYVLVLRLARPLTLDIPRFCGRELPSGFYAYFGSARGPGGLAARVGRHLRGGRRPHWHIDRLLAHGTVAAVLVEPHGRECDWRAAVQGHGEAHVPLRGFGSSDCRACPAHLLAVTQVAAVAGNGIRVGAGARGA